MSYILTHTTADQGAVVHWSLVIMLVGLLRLGLKHSEAGADRSSMNS